MTWLMIFGLAGVAAYLWNRMDQAERRLESVERLQEETLIALRGGAPEAVPRDAETPAAEPSENEQGERESPAPARTVASVPKTAASDAENARVLRVGAPRQSEPTDGELPASDDSERDGGRFALPSFNFDFEDIFGRKLPIWGGGVALAVAGVFMVRYAIDAGLLTPAVRVAMAFLFGVGLIGAAEAARFYREKVADERIPQALAGAGLATLYAGFYLAGSQYGLIGQLVAFLGLAGVTAAAIGLSFRYGLPSAILGLVGGFAAPALVGGDSANVPLLALYLGLVTAGLTFTGERQKRQWMGIAALVGGLGWGALLLFSGGFEPGDVLALGLYFLVLGAVLPALTSAGQFTRYVRLAAAALASFQLAILVDQGGYSMLAWGLYLLLGATLAFLGWRNTQVREASGLAAAIGALLLMQWPEPAAGSFAIVAAAMTVIFAGVPLALAYLRQERLLDLAQIGAVPPILAAIAYAQFGSFEGNDIELSLAGATAALAALPLIGAWLTADRERTATFAALCASGLVLVFGALLMVTPPWSAPLAALPSLAAATWLAHRRSGNALANVLWGGGALAVLSLIATPDFFDELERTMGMSGSTSPVMALLRWLAATAPFAALAWLEKRAAFARAAEALAAILLYCTLAQVLPADALAWMAALLAMAAYFALGARVAGQLALAVIAALWALLPFGEWATAGLASLASDPVFADDVPGWRDVSLRVLPAAAAFALIRFPDPLREEPKQFAIDTRWLAAPFAMIAAHSLFKQAFAIETVTAFVDYGMAERTVWQGLLLGAAWAVQKGAANLGRLRIVAIALAALSLAHFALYTGVIHNALWDRQAVGPAPIANLALAAYAIAIFAALSLRLWLSERWRVALEGLVMVLVTLGAITLLRQLFGGSIPVDQPMSQAEDLLRSLIGIVLAIAFLILGARRNERSWRVGSLILMLIAVAKVFIYDAAGLEGLVRIASFMALGFSLIGIGWIYRRQLSGS